MLSNVLPIHLSGGRLFAGARPAHTQKILAIAQRKDQKLFFKNPTAKLNVVFGAVLFSKTIVDWILRKLFSVSILVRTARGRSGHRPPAVGAHPERTGSHVFNVFYINIESPVPDETYIYCKIPLKEKTKFFCCNSPLKHKMRRPRRAAALISIYNHRFRFRRLGSGYFGPVYRPSGPQTTIRSQVQGGPKKICCRRIRPPRVTYRTNLPCMPTNLIDQPASLTNSSLWTTVLANFSDFSGINSIN